MGILSFFPDGDEIRETITENPGLPIYVIAEDTACEEGCQQQLCSAIEVSVGQIFDNPVVDAERMYTDMDYDDLFDEIYGEIRERHPDATQETLETSAEEVMQDYNKYWRKAIIIRAGN